MIGALLLFALAEAYVLGPEDQILVRVVNAPEIVDRPLRIGLDGEIEVAYVGRIRAAGRSTDELKRELTERLKTIMREPQVLVSVEEYRSQPVSVIGAVNNAGVYQIQGRRTLLEALAMAGGLRQDCGNSIRITRLAEAGPMNLPGEEKDASGKYTTATVRVKSLLEAQNPEENIVIRARDVISAPGAEMVYVVGEVQRAGGFVLDERERLSLLQALSLAGGLSRTASPGNARILRREGEGAERKEIPVHLGKLLSGASGDVEMKPGDILFVPGSAWKRASVRVLEAAIQTGTGIAIWRR